METYTCNGEREGNYLQRVHKSYGKLGIITPDQRTDTYSFKTLVYPGHERTHQLRAATYSYSAEKRSIRSNVRVQGNIVIIDGTEITRG